MKNKKGFTLIELLAVVIIIGLLVIIAFPAVSKYLIDTENDTYSLHEAELKSATANMMSKCIEGNVEDCVPDSGESRTVYLNELIAQKFSTPLKDPANTNNYCSSSDTYVVVTNSTNNVVNLDYQVCLVCSEYKSPICETVKPNDTCDKETDPERPVCGEAVGSSTVWTNADRIISIGCSDTGCGCTQGTFYKRFEENAKQGVITVVDKAGNYTDCVVDVYVDKEVPTCSLTVEGNLGENGWYGGDAPVVKLSYNNADISGIATYGMGVSSKNYDLNKKTSYTVSSGITTVYGYVKDNAGNVGICSVPIKYDPVVPTGEITYGYQVYPKSDIATVDGRNIKLNHFISEYGNVLGANIYLKSNTSGMSVTIYRGSTEIAKRTISAGVTFMKFSFTGNYDGLTIDMGSSSNISLIERVELITAHTTGFYTNKDVIVYATSKDSFSGKGYYSFDGSAWQTSNAYTYGSNVVGSNAKIKDFAGNSSDPITFDITNIDKEVPSCTITTDFEPDGKNGWFKKNFGLTLHPTDVGVSNVRDHNITVNSNPSYTTTLKGTQTTDTKLTTWHGYVRDKAGNVNRCSIDVKLDKVNPTCKVKVPEPDGENGWYITDEVVDYTVFDETSGIEFRGMNVSGVVDYNDVRSMNLDYETKTENFYCYVEDEAGRTNQDSEPYKLDKQNPTCVITPDREIDGENGWYKNNVNLKFTTTSDISPITGYDFIDSETFSYSNKRSEHNITVSTKGITYHGYAKEESGRTSTCELFVKMDKDKPTCTLTAPAVDGDNGWYKSNIEFTLTPTDPISDIQNTGIVSSNTKTYNGKKTLTHTTDKTNIKYWGFVKDNAGNEGTCDSGTERKKDATPPDECSLVVTSGTPGLRGWYVSNVGLKINTEIDDNLSGVVGYDIIAGSDSPVYSHKHTTFTVTANSTSSSGTNHTAYIKDYAGNVTTCSRTVKKDTEKPVCDLAPSGTASSTGWFTSAVTLYLGISDNAGTDFDDVYQYGISTSSTVSYNGKTSYPYSSNTDSNGVDFYCYVEDMAGNTNDPLPYNILIDKNTPSCTLKVTTGDIGNSPWYVTTPTISFVDSSGNAITPSDGESGIAGYYISSSSTSRFYYNKTSLNVYSNTPSSGRTYYGHVADKAGNIGKCELLIYKDSSAPTCSLEVTSGTEGENEWYRSSVTIKGTPKWEYHSGYDSFDVTTSSSATYDVTYSSSKTYKNVYQTADTTGTTYYCHVKDKAGNTRTVTGPTIKKDTVKPSCSLQTKSNFSGWNTSNESYTPLWGAVKVAWNSKEGATAFGMSRDSSVVSYNGITQMSIQQGSATFYGFVKDEAGNESSCSIWTSHSFPLGGGSCSLKFTGGSTTNGWYKSTGKVQFASGGGDNFSWTVNGTSYGEGSEISLSSDGKFYVQAKHVNILGATTACEMMVNIDTTPPEYLTVNLSRTASRLNPSDGYLYAELKSYDATSGLAKWGYKPTGGSWTDRISSVSPLKWYFFGEKNHSGQFRVCDGAGNCLTNSTTTIYIDPCDDVLEEENAGEWSTCSSTCGDGTQKRTFSWTGGSGASCSYVQERDCTEVSGCLTASKLCQNTDATSMFGSSIGYHMGYQNYGAFTRVSDTEAYICSCNSGKDIYTVTGYHRICVNSGACGTEFHNKTAYYIRELDYLEDNVVDCNFDRFWCKCDENLVIRSYYSGSRYIEVYNPFYGG